MKKVSVVIPCYNEEENIKPLYNELSKLFTKKYKFELIFINDGSKDKTFLELKSLLDSKDSSIKIINFSRNFGKEAALYAGIENSTGDYVAFIDADLQQDPLLILPMLEKIENSEYDQIVYYQKKRNEGKILTFFKASFYKLINKLSDVEFVNGASDFRVITRQMAENILSLTERNRFSKGIMSWIGFNTYYMPYEVKKRLHGKTSWSFFGLLKYAIEGVVSFSTVPLKLAVWLGIFFSIFAFIYMIVVLVEKLIFGISVPGYATLVILFSLLGGVELFVIGILGEYIAKIHIETKRRPIYIAKEVLTNDKKTI